MALWAPPFPFTSFASASLQVPVAVRVRQVRARLAVGARQILSRDVQQAALIRLAVDQVLLDGHLVALRRRIEILQLLPRRSARLRPSQSRNAAPIRCQKHLLLLFVAQFGVELVLPARALILHPHDPLITLLTRHKFGDHGAILLVDVCLVDVGPANGVAFIILVILR